MSEADLHRQISSLAEQIGGRTLDAELADWLNHEHGSGSDTYANLRETCMQGIDDGWLCKHEAGGIRYGRVFRPADDLQGFSVDVVDMNDVVGPHHSHPNGEIDLVMPLDSEARFDGHPAGWVVYPAGSAHHPTVSGGRALVLYLLPEGSIEFSR